jgi:hypothetical protein
MDAIHFYHIVALGLLALAAAVWDTRSRGNLLVKLAMTFGAALGAVAVAKDWFA